MPNQFRVEKVVSKSDPFPSRQGGQLIEWGLIARDLSSDRSGNVAIFSDPKHAYQEGQVFWGEPSGERDGKLKLKRVQPPPGVLPGPPTAFRDEPPAPSSTPINSASRAPTNAGGISYEKALAVYKRIASDLDKEHGYEHTYATTMFLAWLNGKIADPVEEELAF